MTKLLKAFFVLSMIFVLTCFLSPVRAQEVEDPDEAIEVIDEEQVEEDIEEAVPVLISADETVGLKEEEEFFEDVSYLDEEVSAGDLEVLEPNLLPTKRRYFFKDMWRGVRIAFIFNKVKKVEKRLEFANERLIEAQKMAEETGDSEALNKVLDKYQKDMEKIADKIEKFKDKDEEKLEKFTEILADRQLKHQKILEKLEEKLPPHAFEKVKEAQDNSLNSFGRVLRKVKNKERVVKRIENVLDNVKGSEFKQFKNLEFLNKLDNITEDEEAQEALDIIRKRTVNKFYEKFNEMDDSKREGKLKKYLDKVDGDEVMHIAILDQLKSELPEDFSETVDKVKERSHIRLENKLKKLDDRGKTKFLERLKKGNMEDLRVLKELENNIDPQFADKIEDIKRESINNFKKRLQNVDSPHKEDEFLRKIKFYDTRHFEVLEDVEAELDPQKKKFLETMRRDAFNNLSDALNRAPLDKKEKLLRKISGDDPNQIEVLQRVQNKLKDKAPEAKGVLGRVIEVQEAKINQRIERIEDKDKLNRFQERINQKPELKARLEVIRPRVQKRVKPARNASQSDAGGVKKVETPNDESLDNKNQKSVKKILKNKVIKKQAPVYKKPILKKEVNR